MRVHGAKPMKSSLAAAIVAASSLLGVSLVAVVRADDKPDAAAARIKRLEDKIAALEASQQKLLERLHDLEFPELRRRDAEEVGVLRLRVEAAKAQRDRIEAFQKAHVIGGEAILLAGAAYRLAAASAELAWAEGRIRDAVQRTAEASIYAEDQARQYRMIFDSGVQKIGSVIISAYEVGEGLAARARADAAILRAVAVAKSAKVDVSDVKAEVTTGRGRTPRTVSLAEVLQLVREALPKPPQPPPK
jgi:hypothetical protein